MTGAGGVPALAVTARRLLDGADIPLESITRLEITSALSSPAGGLHLVAAVERFPGELGAVTVRLDGRVLFQGQVDKMVETLSGAGRTVGIDARTKGALLLDNEAVPCVLSNVRLSTVFGLFAAPYGFFLEHPGESRSLALYTVHKGQSEWEAVTGYTRRVYGRTPYVRGDSVVVDLPRGGETLTIGGDGLPFTKLERAVIPYNILSKVVLRDSDGGYTSAVHNSAAAYYGVQRKRYVIPANEFTDNLALDANQRIRRSMLDREAVSVTLPGILELMIGQPVRVLDGEIRLQNLLIDGVTWTLGRDGALTTVTLVSALYYE